MAKREDMNREPEYDFDPNEILDENGGDADEFDFEAAFGAFSGDDSDLDADLDDILSDDFLASLGISRKLNDKEDPADEFALPELEASGAPEESDDDVTYEVDADYEDEDVQEEDYDEEPGAEADFEEEAVEDELPPPEAPEEVANDEESSLPADEILSVFGDEDDDAKPYIPSPVPAFDVESDLGEEFAAAFEQDFPSEKEENADQGKVPVVDAEPEDTPQPPRTRRRKMSKERMIKEMYLPPAILLLTAILMVSFIGSAISRTVKERQALEESIAASREAVSTALEAEAAALAKEAMALAAGYDYEAALAKLDSFSDDKSQYQTLLDAYNSINQAKSQIKPISDPNQIPNLSFHCLIADPTRAFIDKEWGKSYNQNYVTVDEFTKILDQLYARGYVLVDFDSFIVETVGEDGKITYSTQPIYLPADKKPLMLTETLVNYETFTIDSDGDGEADKGGDGFASKLVVDADGNIVNEYVDSNGNTVYGAYDLVPILENFIKAHPDFSYRGARAILAVTGEDGVFGYRIMNSVKQKKGDDYYNQQVEGAKKIAAALRDAGYTIACYTYANVSYGQLSATKIEVDLDNWKKEVKPVLGDVPVLVYAKASDISADGNYEGGKYNVLKNAGFRYFISSGNSPYADVTVNYVRQSRIMVTGQQMIAKPDLYSNYFTVKEVLNNQRGK